MKNLNISTRIFLGFGSVLALALVVAWVGYVGLKEAERTFAEYRNLARQTNADGRIQANMLMTRIFAKNFVIDANKTNIDGVKDRAERTLEFIRETRDLTSSDSGRQILIDDLEENLQRYVAQFEEVTALQEKRDELVNEKLNVIGPAVERDLTAIMTSALDDGDTEAAYQAGITLRSLLLGRLYTNRFLIENSDAARARAIREFRDLEFNHVTLLSQLENPERRELAEHSMLSQFEYLNAFDEIHQVITRRNNIIQYELDRIGPAVAKRIERLKLAIKEEQDTLGPAAEQALTNSVIIAAVVSVLAITLGLVAAGVIGAGITRPIRRLTEAATAMGKGDLEQVIDTSRKDEIGVLAGSFSAMRESITSQVNVLEKEVAERRRAEGELAKTHDNLERIVEERTAELAAARDDAEKATKAKAEFLATMSHEIRTPMNGVIGMIDLLKQTRMTRDQGEMVETVRTSAYALLTIINDILDFSKIEAGKLNLEAAPMSICDVVEGVTETLAPNAQKKDLEIFSYVDPDIPTAVLGDSVRLRQVLFNLAGNAVKFTEEGRITIRADRMPGSSVNSAAVRFQVIDTGIGISDEAKRTLFQAFTQAESSTTRRYGGTGLGLTISQRIIEIMDGSISVESELGAGSCFTVTLEFPITHDHQIKHESYDFTDINVLLGVGDPMLQEGLSKYLTHSGARVTVQAEVEMLEPQISAAASTDMPYATLFMENVGFRQRTDVVRRIQSAADCSGTNFVLHVDHRLDEREDLDNTVYTVLNPIKRGAFLRSIAASVGLASPDIEFDENDEPIVDEVNVPTIDQAEADGQLILLAEDNTTNQKVIVRQLNNLGYAVVVANDGEEALVKLGEREFAILLTDCHMPNLDGFGLTKRVREREDEKSLPRLPIVAITASALTEEVELCYDAGMDGFLSKPVELVKLRNTLKKWMPLSAAAEAPVNQAATKPANGTGPIDLTFLQELFGDQEEAILEVLRDFVEPSRECEKEVEKAISDKSLKGVAAGTHKLKSAARSIGAGNVADICEKMETASKAGEWKPVETLAPELTQELGQVVRYIDQL